MQCDRDKLKRKGGFLFPDILKNIFPFFSLEKFRFNEYKWNVNI